MNRFASLAVLTLALSWTAFAQPQHPMRPGNWAVTMKMSMPGMKMDLPPMKQTQCITAEMLKDPQSSVPKGPNSGECKVSDYQYTATTVTFNMTCAKPMPMTAVGEMKFTGTDAYTGVIKVDSGGHQMTMVYDAKRVGDCPK